MKITMDGDALCVTTDAFINLHSSPAVFISPKDGELFSVVLAAIDNPSDMRSDVWYALHKQLYDQTDGECRSPSMSLASFGPCGKCDVCECTRVLD